MNTLSVILIDDEVRAIQALSRILGQFPEVRVVATFDDAVAAYDYLQLHDVDGVFADIEMPELNGIEFADALIALKPNIHIVFTTAYAEYAVKAFELASLDYLLKPVQLERMSKTIARMMYAATRRSTNGFLVRTTPTLSIHDTFGQPLIVRWRTERAKQVFVYLLLHANQAVPRDILLDVFWEGYDQTKAAAQLHTTVYLIRKTLAPLENEIQLQTGNGLYTLYVPHNRVDFLDFRALVSKITEINVDFNVKEIRDLRIIGSDVLIDVSEVWIEPFRALIEQTKEEFIINIMSRYARPKQLNETVRSACRLIVADYMQHVDDDITVVHMLKRGLTLNGVHNPDAVIQEFIIQREQ
jgi:two-component SAPR family response regulator